MITEIKWFDYPEEKVQMEAFIASQTEPVKKSHFTQIGKIQVTVGTEEIASEG